MQFTHSLHSFYGIFFIGASSIGNYVDCKRWYMPLIGALWAFSSAYGPYTSIENADKDIYLSTAALILGLGVCVLHIFHMLSLLLPKAWIRRTPLLERILLNQPISGEANVKRAAAFKMSEMTKNALNIAEDKVRRNTETHPTAQPRSSHKFVLLSSNKMAS